MTVTSVGIALGEEMPDWTSDNPQDFVDALLEGVREIDALRDEAIVGPEIRFLPPRPDLWLIAPSLSPGFKQRISLAGWADDDQRAATEFMRRLERQRVYNAVPSTAEVERFQTSKFAQGLASTRNGETGLFAAAIGARTAGTLASTLRLPPAINLVAGKLGALAENIRAEAKTPPHKVARMFGEIQQQLADAVGKPFLERIESASYGIKIVSDAPIEWLPIGDLPLALENDVSRIAATPGEPALLQLMEHEPFRVAIEDFAEILVVSAFEPKDKLAPLMPSALEVMSAKWKGRLKVRHVFAKNRREFISAINAYNGPLMVFDGHVAHSRDANGHLRIGAEMVDVWRLRGQIRVPPIVVLSACDTHAAGRTPYTTANAFLVLGARSVLGTMLPIGGLEGAVFIARLLLRVAEYLLAAARSYGRVVRWSEIAGGMLRMQFVTDALRPCGRPDDLMSDSDWLQLAPEAMYRAGRGGTGWIGWFSQELETRQIANAEAVRKRVRHAVPFSDTIRYVQLGNPETILIGGLKDLSEEAQAEFVGAEKALEPIWREPPSPESLDPNAMIEAANLTSGPEVRS